MAAKSKAYLEWATLLGGTAGPICQPDGEAEDLCCLLGARIHDGAERAAQLAKGMPLLFHVGANDATGQKMGRIKEDCKVLVRQVENISAQVLFSSVLPVREIETEEKEIERQGNRDREADP